MFLVTFPSSLGDPCFLVTPSRVGQRWDSRYPWSRATYVASAFSTREDAQAALDQMKKIHAYIAPECNGNLFKRLLDAKVISAEQAKDIELEIL